MNAPVIHFSFLGAPGTTNEIIHCLSAGRHSALYEAISERRSDPSPCRLICSRVVSWSLMVQEWSHCPMVSPLQLCTGRARSAPPLTTSAALHRSGRCLRFRRGDHCKTSLSEHQSVGHVSKRHTLQGSVGRTRCSGAQENNRTAREGPCSTRLGRSSNRHSWPGWSNVVSDGHRLTECGQWRSSESRCPIM